MYTEYMKTNKQVAYLSTYYYTIIKMIISLKVNYTKLLIYNYVNLFFLEKVNFNCEPNYVYKYILNN